VSNAKTVPGPIPATAWATRVSCPWRIHPSRSAPTNTSRTSPAPPASLPVPIRPIASAHRRRGEQRVRQPDQPGRRAGEAARAITASTSSTSSRKNRTYDQVLGDLGKGTATRAGRIPQKTTRIFMRWPTSSSRSDNFYDTAKSVHGWPVEYRGARVRCRAKMRPRTTRQWRRRIVRLGRDQPKCHVGLSGSARDAANPLSRSLDADTLPGTGNVASRMAPTATRSRSYRGMPLSRQSERAANYVLH